MPSFFRNVKIFFQILLFFLWNVSNAQETWDLERCVTHALENNIQIKKTEISSKISKHTLLQSKTEALPNLNGFVNNNYNFGQTIDPFTNEFATERVQSNAFSLNSSVTLFNGLQTWNTIKQNEYSFLASQKDIDKIKNDISLSVAANYLQVLFNEEQIEIASSQLRISEMQVERTQKLVYVGSLPKGSLLEIEAQKATEELNVVNAENALQMAYLDLKQLLELNASTDFKIEKPEMEIPTEPKILSTPGQVYDAALGKMPQIKSAEYRLGSNEKQLAVAKGGRSPRLALSGSYGTGYSGNRKEVVDTTGFSFIPLGATASGEEVFFPQYTTITEPRSFGKQLDDNLNQSVGLSLSVPIFNGWAVQTNINKARLAIENAEYDLQLARNQLRKDIEQAYANAVAALKKHRATKKSLIALEESFKYTEQKFNVGMVNAVEYNDVKNKLAKAQSDLLQAKYDYVFKTKILDFYQGIPLVF
ncbi:MAG: transporter [Flavobacteriales bacterium]|nr:MAG: transporter [Flavobacteriales bacterium]